MHPLMGLWVRNKNEDGSDDDMAGWVINVPAAYTAKEGAGLFLYIGIICPDGQIREIEFADLVVHLPNELRKRVGVAPNESPLATP